MDRFPGISAQADARLARQDETALVAEQTLRLVRYAKRLVLQRIRLNVEALAIAVNPAASKIVGQEITPADINAAYGGIEDAIDVALYPIIEALNEQIDDLNEVAS